MDMDIDNIETDIETDTPTILPELGENIEIAPTITYDNVRSQIARRWAFDMYRSTLEQAIKTEDASGYVDMSIRREFYLDKTDHITDENLRIVSEEWIYDDANLTKHIKFVTEQILTDQELAEAESLRIYYIDRNIAQQIILDYTLGIGGVTQEEFDSVREYMQSIDPIPKSPARAIIAIVKPSVFDRYNSAE